jgi:hypothetical protein
VQVARVQGAEVDFTTFFQKAAGITVTPSHRSDSPRPAPLLDFSQTLLQPLKLQTNLRLHGAL